jgi:hypothetical protein
MRRLDDGFTLVHSETGVKLAYHGPWLDKQIPGETIEIDNNKGPMWRRANAEDLTSLLMLPSQWLVLNENKKA